MGLGVGMREFVRMFLAREFRHLLDFLEVEVEVEARVFILITIRVMRVS